MKLISPAQFVLGLRYRNGANPTPDEMAKRNRFLEWFPGQAANLTSYQENPNCKCVRELVAEVTNIDDQEQTLSYIEGEPLQIIKPIQAVGRIFTIDDTEAAWKAFVERFGPEMFMFRGLVPVPTVDETGKKTLRVFFY